MLADHYKEMEGRKWSPPETEWLFLSTAKGKREQRIDGFQHQDQRMLPLVQNLIKEKTTKNKYTKIHMCDFNLD